MRAASARMGEVARYIEEIKCRGLAMRNSLVCMILAMLGFAGMNSTRAEEKKALPPLDAVLSVKLDAKLNISCLFTLPGKMDQSFGNGEYRCAVLDKNGVQVEGALIYKVPLRTISLPKNKRSVTDATDAELVTAKLEKGEQYYFVVSVRNLTGLAKFEAP